VVKGLMSTIFMTCSLHEMYFRNSMNEYFHSFMGNRSVGTTGTTSGAGTDYPSGAPAFTLNFSGFRVAQSSASCSVFCRSL